MKIIRTDDFEANLNKLPRSIQRTAVRQIQYFLDNPRHPSLQTKKLKDLEGIYSFRVGRSHRALFFFDHEGNSVLFAIGRRKDIYR